MIRIATLDDIDELVRMGKRFHASSDMVGSFSVCHWSGFCTRIIEHSEGCALVSDVDGVKGMILGCIERLPWDPTTKVALEKAWWCSSGEGVALMNAFEEWSNVMGCIESRMSLLLNMRSLAVMRVLSKSGYEFVEMGARKWL